MCGIAGVIGESDQFKAELATRKMVGELWRRGPDGEGIEKWGAAVLGHRRLAIFDLTEAGRQPMLSEDRSVGIVFNGAIYNYRELRKQLIRHGYRFRSNTDTEVLIYGYQQWGLDELLAKVRGMFAFGIWDNRRQTLYLVRDRLGVKPLVYAVRGNVIAFASTVRALRVAGYVGDVDEKGVMEFLQLGFLTDERSIYDGAVKVPGGTVIEWCDGILQTHAYWKPPSATASPRISFEESVEETERLLLSAVEARIHADVPVGALLSGGIDSSLICWAVKKLAGNITAYTIGTPGDPWDETTAAKETARRLGIEHRVLDMSEDEGPEAEELVSAFAEPFACASALGMLRVSRAVASSAKVLLTGDGGDDVFLGYPRHRHLWLAGKLARLLPARMKSAWLASGSAFPRVGPLRRAAALLDYTTSGLDAFLTSSNSFAACKTAGLIGDRLCELPLNGHNRWSTGGGEKALADLLDYERKTRFVGEYLTKVDGATMHHGLEARSPFLDHVLWEFVDSLPFDLRLHRGRLKAILRELVHRKIGRRIANRRKRGFGIPVQRWILGRWRSVVEAMLRDSFADKEGWIRSQPALTQLSLASPNGWVAEQIWYIFVLEMWLRYEHHGTVRTRYQRSGLEQKVSIAGAF